MTEYTTSVPLKRRDQILQVICEYAKDHMGNCPSQNDLLMEMRKRGFVMSKGTLQVHLLKLFSEGKVYRKDGHLIVTGSRWRLVDSDGVITEAIADGVGADPEPKSIAITHERQRLQSMRKRSSADDDVHSSDIIKMVESQNYRCWWCGERLGDDWHIDHRVPLSRGGTSDLGNLCASCPSCNLKKHDKMPWEFCGRLV